MRGLALAALLVLGLTAGCDKKADAPAPVAAVPDQGAATASAAAAPSAAVAAPPSAAPAAGATKDWLDVRAQTPEGGFRLGNPDAKVKLVEFASLTCPHCRDFHAEAFDKIKNTYVATGKVSYEYRNFVLNPIDLAASLLARCQGAQPFFGLLNSFYTDQTTWIEPFQKLTPADNSRLTAMPQDKQTAALAELGGLDTYVRTKGLPKAKVDACLADKAGLDALLALRKQATDTYHLTGTPGFIINGKTQTDVYTWEQLEPKLKAALL